jgi:phage terminase large subunit-like protein
VRTLASPTCSARFATPRTPDRRTHGGQVAALAKQLGIPLMPWQRQVFDVALEVDDDGRYVYREVIVTVPRQAGKSTALLLLMAHRCLTQPGARVVYTAQNRTDARKKWEDDHLPVLQSSPLASQFRVRLQNGQEAIRWRNGSLWTITSTTEKAGHGMTLDLPVLDEAFAQVDNRMEQAFKPAMATRTNAQFWVTSTAGTEDSHYLNAKVEQGRELVRADVNTGVAYFEWSADPDADLDDPASWWGFHPALGHTIGEDVIATDKLSMSSMEWRRAYANLRTSKHVTDEIIPTDAWLAAEDPRSAATGPVAFAVDVTPDRAYTSICVAGHRADGRAHVEVAAHERGVSWAAKWLAERLKVWPNVGLVLDPSGPAGTLIPELQALGVESSLTRARDMAQACGAFHDAVVEDRLRHIGQPELSGAVSGARRRPLGDAWAWARRDTSVDLAPLVGVTLALWKLSQPAEAPAPTPRVVSLANL